MTIIEEKAFQSTAGFVYVLSNKSMPGIVKIGSTERTIAERIAELSTTGVPEPFALEHYVLVENPRDVEMAIHDALKDFRVNNRREFFKVSVDSAINELKKYFREIEWIAADQSWTDEEWDQHLNQLKAYFPGSIVGVRWTDEPPEILNNMLNGLPSDIVIRSLEKLFKNRPEIWNQIK
jgi:hypothetical protein